MSNIAQTLVPAIDAKYTDDDSGCRLAMHLVAVTNEECEVCFEQYLLTLMVALDASGGTLVCFECVQDGLMNGTLEILSD